MTLNAMAFGPAGTWAVMAVVTGIKKRRNVFAAKSNFVYQLLGRDRGQSLSRRGGWGVLFGGGAFVPRKIFFSVCIGTYYIYRDGLS